MYTARISEANRSARYMALVCIMGDDNPSDRKALIDYNVGAFQKALREVFRDKK